MKKNIKKKVIISVIVVLIILLIPYRRNMLWDGGSIEYKSVLCKYTKVYRLANNSGHYEGVEIEFLGLKIFNSVKLVDKIENKNYNGQISKKIDVVKNNIKELNKFNIYLDRDERVIYLSSSIEEIYLNDRNRQTLNDYISTSWQTTDDGMKSITDYMQLYAELNDGGTKIYKSNEYDLTIIKCNTLLGNKNYFIGDYNIDLDYDVICKS